ncbi:MAG TPA: CPBP family intramembrane glutamic endopeptidase, partial [Verrucomicrobiae bacterium]|nr:CPBP family intramembrane glutamic endopeptidase [Verrucomicrobiae bacterium]
LNSPRLNFYFACFTEASLIGVAALIAAVFRHGMFEQLYWRALDAAWGVAAVGPMLVGFGWTLRSDGAFAANIRRFFEHVIRPVFGGWSLVQLAVISSLAGICEEALFRGALQGGLVDLFGTGPALLVASGVFGLAHPVSKQYIVAAAIIGFLLGELLIMTGNLLAPIVAHAVYDFCALVWFLRFHRGDPR